MLDPRRFTTAALIGLRILVPAVEAEAVERILLLPSSTFVDLTERDVDRLTVSPDGQNLYAASFNEDVLTSMIIDAGTGAVSAPEALVDDIAGVDALDGVSDLVVAPDGFHVYTAAREDDAIGIFSRTAPDGRLVYDGAVVNGIGGVTTVAEPRQLYISADGDHLYVRSISHITVFERDAGTGALGVIQTLAAGAGDLSALSGIFDLAFTADGGEAYAVALGVSGPTLILERDDATGFLGLAGTTSMAGREALQVSADGLNVYGYTGDADLNSYAREPSTGALMPLGTLEQGERDITGLFIVSDALLIGDDYYTTATVDSAVVSFARRSIDGSLVLVRPHFQSTNGPDGFWFIRAIAADPSGRFLYTAGSVTALRIRVFERVDACPTAPATCKAPVQAGRAKLRIKNRPGMAKDLLKWTWKKGTETSAAEIGNPKQTSDYALCVYETGAPGAPVLAARVPGSGLCLGTRPNQGVACWTGGGGAKARFSYLDRTGLSPEGIAKMRIKEGVDGKADNRIQARGNEAGLLQLPSMPLSGTVGVRLHNVETGACWGADFSAPDRNDASNYSARSD